MGQQLNLAFTRNLKIRLLRLCGRQLAISGENYQLFPRPEDVVGLDPELLRNNQFSRQKIDYIQGAARAVIEHELDFDQFRRLPPDDAMAKLIGIKGIGRWTAEYLLVRALGVDDVLPAADIGLRTAVGELYEMGRMASEAEVRDRSQDWAPWRGWVAFYLWLDRLMKRAGLQRSTAKRTLQISG
jgi:DNA-3-methyladenine glycosylase II